MDSKEEYGTNFVNYQGEYGTKGTEGYLDWCECCSDDDNPLCEGNPDAVVEIRPSKTIGGDVVSWILVCTECGCSEHKLTGRKLFPCLGGYEKEKLLKKYNING